MGLVVVVSENNSYGPYVAHGEPKRRMPRAPAKGKSNLSTQQSFVGVAERDTASGGRVVRYGYHTRKVDEGVGPWEQTYSKPHLIPAAKVTCGFLDPSNRGDSSKIFCWGIQKRSC